MIAQQVSVWIMFFQEITECIPVLWCTRRHQIIFICHRPPEIRKGRKTPYQIIKVRQTCICFHGRESPSVIGMKQNQINLDSGFPKFSTDPLKTLPESDVRRRGVPLRTVIFRKSGIQRICPVCFTEHVEQRLIMIVNIMLGKYAHPDFIKRGILHRPDRFPDEFITLIGKCIYRRAKRIECASIFECKMRTGRTDHAVMQTVSPVAVCFSFCGNRSCHLPGIVSFLLRQKADLIDPVPVFIHAVIESAYRLFLTVAAKRCRYIHRCIILLQCLPCHCKFKCFILSHLQLLHLFHPHTISPDDNSCLTDIHNCSKKIILLSLPLRSDPCIGIKGSCLLISAAAADQCMLAIR